MPYSSYMYKNKYEGESTIILINNYKTQMHNFLT